MKKHLSVIVVIALIINLMCFLQITISAATGGIYGNIEWSIENGLLTISLAEEPQMSIGISANSWNIPYTIHGTIPPWYSSRELVTDVIIEDGITEIMENSFWGFVNLQSVVIPTSVIKINDYAFCWCEKLQNIEIPNNVEYIGKYAFYGCKNLDTIEIPSKINTVHRYTFYDCTNLRNIEIHNNIENIELFAFSKSGIKSVVIPNSITALSNSVFRQCEELESVILGTNVEVIDSYAFYGCKKLKEINLGNNLKSVGHYSFYECVNLTNVDIPQSVTSIDEDAFYGCTSIKKFIVEESNNYYCTDDDGVLFDKEKTTLLRYPPGKTDENYIIPDSISQIGANAFSFNAFLKNITLHENIESIGYSAFSNCISLLEIDIPNKITIVEAWTFYACSSLQKIIIPEGVTRIENNVFEGCVNLRKIFLPSTLAYIGGGMYAECVNLTEIYYNGSQESFDNIEKGNQELMWLFYFMADDKILSFNMVEENTMGGKVISFETKDEGDIYYTLNGDEPSLKSKKYTHPFTIDEAKVYDIKAVMYSHEKDKYSPTLQQQVTVNDIKKPEVIFNNGYIYITPSENVYYTTDLTREPTIRDVKYTEPFLFEGATLKVRCIKEGYAPSETTIFVNENNDEFKFPDDSYNFENTRKSFGYGGLTYKIPRERYTEVFGKTIGKSLYECFGLDDDGRAIAWGGSCFGLSATSLMFNNDLISPQTYDSASSVLYDVPAPKSKNSNLTRLIEKYQVAQFLPETMTERSDPDDGGNRVVSGQSDNVEGTEAMLAAVKNFCETGKEPIILIVWKNELAACHAVVPYKVEGNRIYVYDSNNPYSAESDNKPYIEVTLNGSAYDFSFGEYSYAISYNTLNPLLNGLEGISLGRTEEISLFDTTSEKDAEKLLLTINSKDVDIVNSKGVSVEDIDGVISYSTTDAENVKTVLSLPMDTYKITNNNSDLEVLKVTAANEDDYYTLETTNNKAVCGVGVSNNRLYIDIQSDEEILAKIKTYNSEDKVSTLEVTSNYIHVISYNKNAVSVSTNTTSIKTDDKLYAPSGGGWASSNASNKLTTATSYEKKDGICCKILKVQVPEIIENKIMGTISVTLKNNDEDSVFGKLFLVLYDLNGRMVHMKIVDDIEVLSNKETNFDADVNWDNLMEDKYKIKVFYWDEMIPLSDKYYITIE